MRIFVIAIAAAVVGFPAAAIAEQMIKLRPGPGADKVEAKGWDATVTKMIKAFGAPIDDADAKAIADYLKKNYGI